MKANNIVPVVKKIEVECVNFILPHGDGLYKLFVDKNLYVVHCQFWTDKFGEEPELVSTNKKALTQFCEDIDIHVERSIDIPNRVWEVIKANPICGLWFVEGLNIGK